MLQQKKETGGWADCAVHSQPRRQGRLACGTALEASWQAAALVRPAPTADAPLPRTFYTLSGHTEAFPPEKLDTNTDKQTLER